MEKKMRIIAWKQVINKHKQPVYKLQLEGKMSSRERKKILAELEDWKEVGYGWNKNNTAEIRLFTREFEDKNSWFEWVQDFPFEIQEINRNGKIKKIN